MRRLLGAAAVVLNLVLVVGFTRPADATGEGLVVNVIRDYPAGHPALYSPPTESVLWVNGASPVAGDGSEALPFRTVEAGLRAARAGDTVVVKGGIYREQISLSPAPGTAAQPIVVRAADGERPVVQGLLWLNHLEHWTIEGINVTWDPQRNDDSEHMVRFGYGNDWTFRDAEVWGAESFAGVLVGGSATNWRLSGLHIHDTIATNDTNQDHLVYVSSGSGGGVIERNLLVGSTNGRAIKIGTVGDATLDIGHIVVRYNTMVDNLGPSNVRLSYRAGHITLHNNLMVGSRAGYHNISTYNLTGDLSTAFDNWGWGSAGVVEADPGLTDGGGNIYADPGLDAEYRPTNPAARLYGHLAPVP